MKKAKGKPAGGKITTRKGKKENKETKRGAVEKFTQEQVIEAIEESNGLLAGAARILKCSRTTIYRYVEQYKAVKAACNEANETTKDFVENKLIDAIRANNITAIIFYLKTKAKDRGYIERAEYTGKDGQPLPAAQIVTIYIPNNNRDDNSEPK